MEKEDSAAGDTSAMVAPADGRPPPDIHGGCIVRRRSIRCHHHSSWRRNCVLRQGCAGLFLLLLLLLRWGDNFEPCCSAGGSSPTPDAGPSSPVWAAEMAQAAYIAGMRDLSDRVYPWTSAAGAGNPDPSPWTSADPVASAEAGCQWRSVPRSMGSTLGR